MAANTQKMKNTKQNEAADKPEEKTSPASAVTKAPADTPIVAKEIDPSRYVPVKSGFHGRLVYKSQRTGELLEWEDYGDEQDMELRELKAAKASAKAFFSENWFLLDDWVIRYLGVEGYYRRAVTPEELDKLFSMKPDALREEIGGMTAGQRDSVIYRAKELISEHKLDSLRVINSLEEILGVELIEK